MAERKIKAWITVNGVHVPLYEGESKDDAVKRSIKQAQENRRKDDDQKEKDIARNQSEKDNLNKANSLVDEQNRIMEKYGPKSKEYQDFKKKKDEFLGKKVNHWDNVKNINSEIEKAESSDDIEKIKDNIDTVTDQLKKDKSVSDVERNQIESKLIDAYDKASRRADSFDSKKVQAEANKGSLSDASSGKASDEARVKKETVSDYDKEFGTVGKVDINNAPSAQLMKRLNDLSLGDEPVGKFWDKSAELYSVYKQLYSVANQKDSGFKFTKQNEAAMYQYRRYYNDGDVPGWARGPFNEYSKSTYNRSWGYHTTLSGQGEMELERRANKAVVSEYKRYQKFINTVPKSFAANYPNLSNTELKKKYQEFLKKNKK